MPTEESPIRYGFFQRGYSNPLQIAVGIFILDLLPPTAFVFIKVVQPHEISFQAVIQAVKEFVRACSCSELMS
jgi:hypothetical protein